jgi:D-amino peptidase
VLITGDDATCREGRDLLGDGLHAVSVKRGLSKTSARQIPPRQARQMIEEGAKRALSSPIRTKPYVPARPTTITIELGLVEHAKDFRGRNGIEIVEPLKVVSRGKDWMGAWNNFWGW